MFMAPSRVEVFSDELTLARLSAAVRWLRRRADILPNRMGVVGWSWGGEQALALAASTPFQACVICDGDVTDDPPIIAGLRGTAVLGVFAGNERIPQKGLPAFQKALSDSQIVYRIKESPVCLMRCRLSAFCLAPTPRSCISSLLCLSSRNRP
jgi:dienelactone hydrolase